MEFEFDKEIDAILRRARHGEVVTSAGLHLDADEISAFAENAVSDAARQRFTSHLADCTRCRKILSNVIVFNSEAETEAASSAVSVETTAETKTPWFRKLFVFPQLAYAMGGLVLLFSGFFGYLILQNLPGAGSSEVSYSTNTAAPAIQSAPSNSTVTSTANSNTASTAANSAVQANTNSTTNSASVPSSNVALEASTPADKKAAEPESNSSAESVRPAIVPQSTPPAADVTGDAQTEELAKVTPAAPTAGAAAQNRAKEDRQKNEAKDAARSDDNEIVTTERDDSKLKSMPAPKTAKKQTSNAGESRSVGGKIFNNVGGIWFDSAVGKQKQKTVRRGTSEYQKLDAGLRSIADSLGGTVVILWGGRAYRIQ
jgi:hypothetical protein